MGRYTFRLPDIGEGIAEAEIVAWHVRIGDRVEEDGRLADMMTDKATVEMESPVAGVVREIAGEVGDRIAIGSPLAVIEIEGADFSLDPDAQATEHEDRAARPADLGEARLLASPSQENTLAPATSSTRAGRAQASPAVRARARTLGIDLATVRPGSNGIVSHADLDAFLVAHAPVRPSETKRASDSLSGAIEQIKVVGLRRRIAENMAASKRHIPHFSYVDECDVTELEALRGRLNAERGDRSRLKLLPFVITAICRAVPDFPMINARFDDDVGVVTRYASVHLGIAVQTSAGLTVPVIRDAQRLGLSELGAEIARLAAAARRGSAKADELSGSTLTVTSLGPLGGIATTPVINRPEVAIIGPNRIVERAVFVPDGRGGERIVKRKLMNMSISCDHRVVDGWDAARFVSAVKKRLEAPLALLAG